MLIGTLRAEILIHGATSLKEKRFVLKSLKDRIRNQFNVSVAEVEYQDKWQRSVLGVAWVSNDRRFLDKSLNKIIQFLLSDDRIELIDEIIEIL